MVASIPSNSASQYLPITTTRSIRDWDEMVKNYQELEFLKQTHSSQDEASLKLLSTVLNDAGRRAALFDRLEINQFALAWVWQGENQEVLEMLWDLEIVPRKLEIPFLSGYRNGLEIELMFEEENRRSNLISRYQNDLDALVVIWKRTGDSNVRKKLWTDTIFQHLREIQFLSKIGLPGDKEFSCIDCIGCNFMKSERKALIQRYATDAPALAVIWKIFGRTIQSEIWDNTIVRNGIELEFLSHLDKPGAALSRHVTWLLKEQRHFGKTREEALVEKYPAARKQIEELMKRREY